MKKNNRIPIKNIYYMLSYAFHVLNQTNIENVATEEFDNIYNLFAAILCKGIGQQIKQGLYRDYLECCENLSVVRGKIEMVGSIRNKVAHRQLISCEYDEFSENNLYNQILKTTTFLLLKSKDVDKEYKDILKKEMTFFSTVDSVNPYKIRWTSIRFHRNNQTYRMLVGICRLIIEGMLMTESEGNYKLMSFDDDQQMYHLYEKFLREYYIKEYPQIKVTASKIPWALDDGYAFMLPTMQSDIILSYKGTVLIIDAKYYSHIVAQRFGKETYRSDNLYQIFTYVKNEEENLKNMPHEVSGMLLYARTNEDSLVDCTYKMSGNTIAVKTLDLNCDFSVIREQLNKIVKDFFGITVNK